MAEAHALNHGEMYRAGSWKTSLGARLFCAGRQVRPGALAADIGCDHGKLAVWLALHGGAKKVIAVDNRPLPLARAKALVRQTGCEDKVDCRLGEGLTPLTPGEAEDIVVAGLSAETIAQVLGGCAWLRDEGIRLVLAPVTRHDYLRRWLCQNGFGLLEEHLIQERERLYTVMVVGFTGRAFQPDEVFCQLGLLAGGPVGERWLGEAEHREPNALRTAPRRVSNSREAIAAGGPVDFTPIEKPLLEAYIRRRLAYLEKQALGLKTPAERRAHRQLIREVAACLP